MHIALIRHGRTEWNTQKRVQGTIETSLSTEGREAMGRLKPPAGFETARAFVSPQRRARETAALLGLVDPIVDVRLREQNWGKWEGLTRSEMLARDGDDCFRLAGVGMEFRPPDGESTADLAARVKGFLIDIANTPEDAVAVTHMGVLRTAYALATGWDMSTPMPDELDLTAALVLSIEGKSIALFQLNAALQRK